MAAEQKKIASLDSHSDKGVSSPNVKDENEVAIHSDKSPRHHEETHGTSDDIGKNTPIGKVKGPSLFQRAKEEVEAVVETVLPKK